MELSTLTISLAEKHLMDTDAQMALEEIFTDLVNMGVQPKRNLLDIDQPKNTKVKGTDFITIFQSFDLSAVTEILISFIIYVIKNKRDHFNRGVFEILCPNGKKIRIEGYNPEEVKEIIENKLLDCNSDTSDETQNK